MNSSEFPAPGSLPPLFIIPGYSGEISLPEPLARRLAPVCDCRLELKFPGVTGPEKPLDRVEELAANLIRQIRQILPDGPWRLCGFSFGGNLAHEMACQMNALNLPVEVLILWDAFADRSIPAGRRPLPAAIAKLCRRLKGRDAADKWRVLQRTFRLDQRMDPLRGALGMRRATAEISAAEAAVRAASRRAHVAHRPKTYSGDAVVFRSADRGGIFLDEPHFADLGWSEFVRGRVEVVEIPGCHEEIWEDPMVDKLGESTAAWLVQRKSAALPPRMHATGALATRAR